MDSVIFLRVLAISVKNVPAARIRVKATLLLDNTATLHLQPLPLRTGPPLLKIHALARFLARMTRQCGKGPASTGNNPSGHQRGTFEISSEP